MVVSKILEGTLTAGQTSISFTDADLPNSLIRVFSSNPDIIPVSRTLTSTTLTVVYEAQLNNLGVAVEIVKDGMTINDTLTSEATDEALSAKQGKYLNDELQQVFTSVSNGKALIAGAITDKGVDTPADATFSEMAENISEISTGIEEDPYILDPSVLDTLNVSGLYNNVGCVQFAQKTQGSGFPGFSIATYDSNPTMCLPYYGNRTVTLFKAIPADATSIEIDVGITTSTYGQYNNSHIFLSTGKIPVSMTGAGGTVLKNYVTTMYGSTYTPAVINSQEGLTINSTNQYILSRQTVKIDVSGINEDCYISFHTCDCNMYIRSIKYIK